jgi:DNA-binding transcriptional regulator/RsmH inhibitor MraZ
VKVFLRIESDIPPTLTRYGKIRIPPKLLPVLAEKGRALRVRYSGETVSLKVDKYGRATLPMNIAAESQGKSKMVIEMSDGDVRLEFR